LPLSYPTTMRRCSSTTAGWPRCRREAADLGERTRRREVDATRCNGNARSPARTPAKFRCPRYRGTTPRARAPAPAVGLPRPCGSGRRTRRPGGRRPSARGRATRCSSYTSSPSAESRAIDASGSAHVATTSSVSGKREHSPARAGTRLVLTGERAEVLRDQVWSGSTTKLLYGRTRRRDASTARSGPSRCADCRTRRGGAVGSAAMLPPPPAAGQVVERTSTSSETGSTQADPADRRGPRRAAGERLTAPRSTSIVVSDRFATAPRPRARAMARHRYAGAGVEDRCLRRPVEATTGRVTGRGSLRGSRSLLPLSIISV
jgi:hypothetical protein